MHGGFVGKGMLDAACPGAIFTSPTPDQMHAATKAVAGEKGALHIVKNYTGDVMNFALAAEMLRGDGMARSMAGLGPKRTFSRPSRARLAMRLD